MHVLLLSGLYPNANQPRLGQFVERRLMALVATGRVAAKVVAPVPWFFSTHPRFGRYALYASIPQRELRHGIEILHPRYPVIPRLGMALGPAAMAMAVTPTLRRLRSDGFDFDLIDANYFYPDGVAAARLARRFDRPFVVTARGTDVNILPDFARPRQQIRKTIGQAAALLAVSRPLHDRLLELGARTDQVTTLANGVDLDIFNPGDAALTRAGLNLKGQVWLVAGNLVPLKGVDLVIEALAQVPDVTLLIAGDGEQAGALRSLTRKLGVSARVRFLGSVPQEELPDYYRAADVLVLASRMEGMPNVIYESLACGTPVIASPVGGVPDVITGPSLGLLLAERSAAAIVAAWEQMRACGLGSEQEAARRAYAQTLGWEQTAARQLAIYENLLNATLGRNRE